MVDQQGYEDIRDEKREDWLRFMSEDGRSLSKGFPRLSSMRLMRGERERVEKKEAMMPSRP